MHSKSNISIAKLKQQPRHGGLFDDLNKFANNSGVSKAMKDLATETNNFVKSLPAAKDLFTTMTDELSRGTSEIDKYSAGLGRALAYQKDYNDATIAQIKNLTFLEEANKELNKSFGQSVAGAFDFSKTLRGIGVDIKRGDAAMFRYANTLKGVTGGFISSKKAQTGFQADLLKGQAYLQDNMQLTEEQAASFELYAAGIGKSGFEAAAELKGLTDALSDSTGIDATQLQKQILEDISGITADLQLQYSKIPGSLEVASLKARVLGTSLADLNKTGQGLLNIESSIGQELEYQALTGQRLLTDQGKSLTNEYRMATIRGDANKQADLMNQFIKKQGKQLETNLFARKKAAELMGTDEATLAKMIQKQKLAAKLGADKILELNQGDLEATAKELREKGADEDDIKQLLELSDTRTDVQKQTAALASIDSKIIEGAQIGIGGGAGFAASMSGSAEAATKFARKMSDVFGSESVIKGLGNMGILADKVNTLVIPITQLGDTLPIVGGAFKKLSTTLTDATKKLKAPITVTEKEAKETQDVNDILITPNDGPIIRPAADDVIMAFKQGGGTIANTLSNVNAGASTGLTATAIATAMVAALRQSPIYTEIKTDTLYAGSTMNGKPNLG